MVHDKHVAMSVFKHLFCCCEPKLTSQLFGGNLQDFCGVVSYHIFENDDLNG